MNDNGKTLTVSQAALHCGVGRTTVGYWIRSKKLTAHRVGRNYAIPVEDLLFFLKNSGQKIPYELMRNNAGRAIFRSFQPCWQYWDSNQHKAACRSCLVFKNRVPACFTLKPHCAAEYPNCGNCPYYIETFLPRIQFVHQIHMPAAIYKDLHLWGANSLCADLCQHNLEDIIGMGIEKIVHPRSLAAVIETTRKKALGDLTLPHNCTISINRQGQGELPVVASIHPLREPEGAFLVLAEPTQQACGF